MLFEEDYRWESYHKNKRVNFLLKYSVDHETVYPRVGSTLTPVVCGSIRYANWRLTERMGEMLIKRLWLSTMSQSIKYCNSRIKKCHFDMPKLNYVTVLVYVYEITGLAHPYNDVIITQNN